MKVTWCLTATETTRLIRDGSLRVQELRESRGGRLGLSVLMSLIVSVDVKQHSTMVTVYR